MLNSILNTITFTHKSFKYPKFIPMYNLKFVNSISIPIIFSTNNFSLTKFAQKNFILRKTNQILFYWKNRLLFGIFFRKHSFLFWKSKGQLCKFAKNMIFMCWIEWHHGLFLWNKFWKKRKMEITGQLKRIEQVD